jgi:PAS domain-containing protein
MDLSPERRLATREGARAGVGSTAARRFALRAAACALLGAVGTGGTGGMGARAETCTTQSGLSDAERNGLVEAARGLALKVQANDAAGLRSMTVAEVAKDFGGLQYLVAVTAPKLAGGTPAVEQVYVLDGSNLQRGADGKAPDAQFFCSLNRSTMEADFVIPALPPGKYGFAMVDLAPGATSAGGTATVAPWRLTFLLRQEPAGQPQSKWMLAGFYPKATTAAGHDGLWYWTQARQMTAAKQPWDAWLDYQEAQHLLQPADFVLSTHLDKLRTEAASAAPPALSDGVSVDAPLVVKGADGTEYHFTALTVEDSPDQTGLDVAVRLHVDAAAGTATDAAGARKRNDAAASALLAAYPEMRKAFHGVHMVADSAGQAPVASEQAMAEIK